MTEGELLILVCLAGPLTVATAAVVVKVVFCGAREASPRVARLDTDEKMIEATWVEGRSSVAHVGSVHLLVRGS
jgi:hypothetical protein